MSSFRFIASTISSQSSTAGSWPATSSVDIGHSSYRRFKTPKNPLVTRKNGIGSKASVLKAILSKHRVPVEKTVHDQQTGFNTHVALQANVAMLDFAKKLPLEELRMIGYQPTVPTSVKRGNTAVSEERTTDSKTLHFGPNSDSTWSFACSSARRIERGHTAPDEDDDTLSFESLLDWVVGPDRDKVDTDATREPNTNDTWNAPRVLEDARDAGIGTAGRSTRNLSLSHRSVDSCDLFLQSISFPIHETSFSMMSDEEFEALPDWSDVEEEDEYNVYLERYHHWSNTNSAYSSRLSMEADFVFPTISVPPGFSAAVLMNTGGNGCGGNDNGIGQATAG
ncbi:hypothetical protein A1F94_008016 [Pyrenophora tritici-repentis]|nr:hypothetical protein PtrV1_06374 [Pyrenophora tritici-repentis]KAF7451091.1 hypothetical protein A1F99_057070 [Pyrenophora tritici-repentis]KAF7573778.1 hypothetical protein PtrM4_086830 [Pyrenophora tritici-repentis]KAG9380696.1 hypothetical protein A1F94_008016 [Pyrenophora tritici-repentis]KAI0574596.1 hypothetical protein Alg215_08499 [Pyrenophora tritici-repentis]